MCLLSENQHVPESHLPPLAVAMPCPPFPFVAVSQSISALIEQQPQTAMNHQAHTGSKINQKKRQNNFNYLRSSQSSKSFGMSKTAADTLNH